jgi:hypothetical protein
MSICSNSVDVLLKNINIIRFGAFDNDILISSISFKDAEVMPYATLSLMIHRPDEADGLLFNSSSLRRCIQAALDYGEEKEIYTFYSLRRVAEFRIQARRELWDGWNNKKYIGFTECYIPAGTLPERSWFKKIIGNIPPMYDSLLRCQRLRDTYRFLNYKGRVDPGRYDILD